MQKIYKATIVFTKDEYAEFIREAKAQDRSISYLGRKYINAGVKRDKDANKDEKK